MAAQKAKDESMSRTLANIQRKKSKNEKREAQQEAAKEEQEFVKYRIHEVLARDGPKSHVKATTDEKFPKKPPPANFGVLKSKYLHIRPDPRFATWPGKKKGEVVYEARARRMKPIETKATDHSTMSSSFSRSVSSKKSSAKDKKDKKDDKQRSVMANIPDNDVMETLNCEDEEENEKRKGGHRRDNPLENGVPFWMIGSPRDQDELTDDDLPIDMSLLEEVCNKTRNLKDPLPARDKFHPFATVDQLKRNDHYFDKEMLLSITVSNILTCQENTHESDPKRRMVDKEIVWSKTLTEYVFDPTNRGAGYSKPQTKPVADINRVKGAKDE
ncbi:unnamed protein product [Bursaphelenchus okinawaensis]|uniref:Uncharacterized protein n=1 Tax=Bursaphelenchus okinawaensis TaxID=465554 RepID=A0A811LK61_9BILA|nr:unnamed protein product [Bursaphelenchus okinawaensis]CAG9123403.1 unnamed protein product [Bursaphelenchus okinawaensis]